MIGTVVSAVSALASLIALAPAGVPAGGDPPPAPPGPGTELPERRLAEFSFAIFLTIELGLDPGEFTCSEPQVEGDVSAITCFALIDETRVIVAVTNSSEGTGVYDWTVISDHVIGADSPPTTTAAPPTPPPTSVSSQTTNLSDAAILSYGEELNRGAEAFKADVIASTQGSITAITAYAWDPATATVTLDVTLDPSLTSSPDQLDRAAWILVQVLKLDWVRGEPFRLEGATLRPGLVVVVNSTQYASDFDLMVRVADQLITNTDWAVAARTS